MDRSKLLNYLAQVAPERGRLESYADRIASVESLSDAGLEALPTEPDVVTRTLAAVSQEAPLGSEELSTLEAIILPGLRPVVDVVDGSFVAPAEPFAHLGLAAARAVIEKVLPSVGRIELPDHPSLPFGGTGFVVGDGLLMTNRHVAELFSSGLGTEGLAFLVDRGAGIDFLRERDRPDSMFLTVDRVVMIHPFWDMALLKVTGLPSAHPALTLSTVEPGDLAARDVVVVGYPAIDPRNNIDLQNTIFGGVFNVKRLQPGKMGPVQPIRSFGHTVSAVTHDCSTLGGNSGSAVVDVEKGTVLALHFAGRYLEANFGVPAHALSLDRRVVDAGVVFDEHVRTPPTTEWDGVWVLADPPPGKPTESTPLAAGDGAGGDDASTITQSPAAGGAGAETITLNVPIEITVRIGGRPTVSTGMGAGGVTSRAPAAVVAGIEAMVEPFRDEDLANRTGYDPMFLGVALPLPTLHPGARASTLDDGSTELRYEHFSGVMNKDRRLAHFLAANVDGSLAKTRPEPGRDYSRKGLTGLDENDQEKWFTDPRIPAVHQLPDRFFTRDRKSFDKGHIIRRTYVAWGDTFDQVRRANGDTYHVTNCSPQVAAFNRSNKQGIWGELENLIQAQAKAERYSVFAGPIFRADDPPFEGVDDKGKTTVLIPKTFWKIIVARTAGDLQAFAFKLDQDLSAVDFTELAFEAPWLARMISVDDLESAIGTLSFPAAVHQADQATTDLGETVRRHAEVELAGG